MNFLNRYSRNPQILNFIKIPLVGADLFHADRQTDGQSNYETNRLFRNFTNVPINICNK